VSGYLAPRQAVEHFTEAAKELSQDTYERLLGDPEAGVQSTLICGPSTFGPGCLGSDRPHASTSPLHCSKILEMRSKALSLGGGIHRSRASGS